MECVGENAGWKQEKQKGRKRRKGRMEFTLIVIKDHKHLLIANRVMTSRVVLRRRTTKSAFSLSHRSVQLESWSQYIMVERQLGEKEEEEEGEEGDKDGRTREGRKKGKRKNPKATRQTRSRLRLA